MPEERPFLPMSSNPDEPYNLAQVVDDIDATITDPYERAVARQVAFNMLVDFGPDSRGDAYDRLANSSNQARRSYWDRAAQEIGQPTLTEKAVEHSLRNPIGTDQPYRNSRGEVEAFCGGCGASEAGDGSAQFKWVDCRRFWCERCLEEDPDGSRHADMQPWSPPKYELSPSGGFTDAAEQEWEARKMEAELNRRRVEREAAQAERAEDAESLRQFEKAKAERDQQENRLQNPWAVSEGAA